MRRRRKQQEAEEERDGRRLRAALRKAQRELERELRSAGFYKLFEPSDHRRGNEKSAVRDLFIDWISRGFESGRTRTNQRGAKRNSARNAKWSRGEFAGKIRYVFRPDGLEEVAGNILTSMGGDIEEAVACGIVIESLEKLDRCNAGVYKHIIIGLPHQLMPEQRAKLLAELVRPLREMGLPFCAALHKPDPGGDQRNFHAHILLSLRPMSRVGDRQWDFSAGKLTWLDCPEGILLQRRYVAMCFNRALTDAGSHVRWTAKSRSRRGVASPGNNKKGAEKTRTERGGAEAERKLAEARAELTECTEYLQNIDAIERLVVRLDEAFDERIRASEETAAAASPRDVEASPGESPPEVAPARGADQVDEPARGEMQEDAAPAAVKTASDPVTAEQGSSASAQRDHERLAAAANARAEAARERERREKEKLRRRREADALAYRKIKDRGLWINNEEALSLVRLAMVREGDRESYVERTNGGDYLFQSYSLALGKDVEKLSESEGGHLYLMALFKNLGPPPEEERPFLTCMLIPASGPPPPLDPRYRARERGRGLG